MKKTLLLLVASALLLSESHAQITCASTTYKYEKVNFYVVAHQDDWQLFMGAPAYRAIHEGQNLQSSQKNVFIYVTAGNAWNSWSTGYTQARDKGAMASIKLAADQAPDTGSNTNCATTPVSGQAYIYSPVAGLTHTIEKVTYKNTVSYFIRLPDAGTPFSAASGKEYTHLNALRLNELLLVGNADRPSVSLPMQTVDGLTSYYSWSDLTSTLNGIMSQEVLSAGAYVNGNVWLNVHDPQYRNRRKDHPDHMASTYAALDASITPNVTYYIGYISNLMPVNLSPVEIIQEAGMYAAYNALKTDSGHSTDWKWGDNDWCSRCYLSSTSGYSNYTDSTSLPTPARPAVDASTPAYVQQAQTEARLYPNPVHDQMTVTVDKADIGGKRLHIEVYNAMTESKVLQVQAYSVTDKGVCFSVAGLKPGHYIVRMATGTTVVSKRFEKE